MQSLIENREQEFYLVKGKGEQKFEILEYNDLKNTPSLESFTMSRGYDGYMYTLRAVVEKGAFAEIWHCLKKENEPFVKTSTVFNL